MCKSLANKLPCAKGTSEHVTGGYIGRRGLPACARWCKRPDDTKHGPYAHVAGWRSPERTTGAYHQGKRDGEWRTYRKNKLHIIETFRNGKLHGMREARHYNGRLAEREFYARGELHGARKAWAFDGSLKASGSYRAGKKIGVHKRFSGRLPVSVERYDKAGLAHGRFCYWHKRGRSCFSMRRGTGTMRSYDERGRVVGARVFVAGDLRRETQWDRNTCGRPALERTSWRNGKRHGAFVSRECEYGAVKIVSRGRYCTGDKCGVWTRRFTKTRAKEREVYNRRGDLIAKTVWGDSGRIVDNWSVKAIKRAEHLKCLRELKRGGCCDPEQNPPKGAKMCINGQKSRRRPGPAKRP